jgi:hypothetical protein
MLQKIGKDESISNCDDLNKIDFPRPIFVPQSLDDDDVDYNFSQTSPASLYTGQNKDVLFPSDTGLMERTREKDQVFIAP